MELGTIVPENGGIQEYLRHCYGDVYGFMFAWIWIFVVKPCSMAMVSLIFAEYLYRTVLPGADISTWVLKSTALLGIGFTTALNCMGTHLGVLSANVFMGVKVLGLSSIAVIGVAFQITSVIQGGSATEPEKLSPAMESPTQFQVSEQGSSLSWMGTGDLADALFAALFAYGGWESVSTLRLRFDPDLPKTDQLCGGRDGRPVAQPTSGFAPCDECGYFPIHPGKYSILQHFSARGGENHQRHRTGQLESA